MTTLLGIVVIIVGLLVYIGQGLSFFAPALATKIGLNDPPEEMDESLYIIETKANGLGDLILAWVLPISGLLMILDHAAWTYLALIGSGIYIYFALLTIFCRIYLKRYGKKVGNPTSEKTAYIFSGIWIACACAMIFMAVQELSLA